MIVSGIESISAALGAEQIGARSTFLSVFGRLYNNALFYDILSPARFVALMYYLACGGEYHQHVCIYILVYVWVGGDVVRM